MSARYAEPASMTIEELRHEIAETPERRELWTDFERAVEAELERRESGTAAAGDAERLRERIQAAMEDGLRGVWAEYPRECESALDLVMEIVLDAAAASSRDCPVGICVRCGRECRSTWRICSPGEGCNTAESSRHAAQCPICGAFISRAVAGKCENCGTEWDNSSDVCGCHDIYKALDEIAALYIPWHDSQSSPPDALGVVTWWRARWQERLRPL